LVGSIFFDFFKLFLAILFSLPRFAQLGIAALICNVAANVHIHFPRRETTFSLAFPQTSRSLSLPPALRSVAFFIGC
jgi:hypothetical protein